MKHLKKFNENAIGINDDGIIDHSSKHADRYRNTDNEPTDSIYNGAQVERLIKSGDVEKFRKAIESGQIDPNIENGLIPRICFGEGQYEIAKIYVENGGDLTLRRNMACKWAAETANMEALNFLLENGLRLDERAYKDVCLWVETSDRKSDEEKVKVFEFLPKFKK